MVRVLERLAERRGVPAAIRMDNGPALISTEFVAWCERRGVEPRCIRPGKPDQNACIERLNRSFREDVLNAHVFADLDPVRELSTTWQRDDNEERPHEALGSQPPAAFRALVMQQQNAAFNLPA